MYGVSQQVRKSVVVNSLNLKWYFLLLGNWASRICGDSADTMHIFEYVWKGLPTLLGSFRCWCWKRYISTIRSNKLDSSYHHRGDAILLKQSSSSAEKWWTREKKREVVDDTQKRWNTQKSHSFDSLSKAWLIVLSHHHTCTLYWSTKIVEVVYIVG